MAGVLVFGDVAGGRLTPATLEAVSAGAMLARESGGPLCGALIGHEVDGAARQLAGAVPAVYVVDDEQHRDYLASGRVAAAAAVIEACSPAIVLFTHTLATREWAPQLAARLDSGLVMDCTAFALEAGALVATKPVYGGGAIGEFLLRGPRCLATVRAGAFPAAMAAATGSIVPVESPPSAPTRVTFLGETAGAGSSGPSLKDAKVVVAGGRGLGAVENWHHIDEIAALLGAAVGCSRPVADSGWVSTACQVGLSGTCVTPDLYLAVGISGAVQHLAGISAAKTVVAVNLDSSAEIFTRADLGVVGDYREVLPAFAQRVRELKA